MLSDYISPGIRIEIGLYDNEWMEDGGQKVYASKIYDIISEERIDAMMPIEKGQIKLLPLDASVNIAFYAAKGLYECYGKVVDRYKVENMYIVTIDLTGSLQKLQRREYYRFTCTIPMFLRSLTELEDEIIKDNPFYNLENEEAMDDATIVDISGGGIRFLSRLIYDEGSKILIKFSLNVGIKKNTYTMIGRILKSEEVQSKAGIFEHRVQYTNIDEDDREDIIHYIFEEERKMMRRI